MQKEIARYLQQAGKNCPRAYRKKLGSALKSSLNDFLSDYPNCKMDDVVAHFGTPTQFADEYILSLDESERKRLLKKSTTTKWCAIIGTMLIVLAVVVAAVCIVIENSRTAGVYYSESVIDEGIIEES